MHIYSFINRIFGLLPFEMQEWLIIWYNYLIDSYTKLSLQNKEILWIYFFVGMILGYYVADFIRNIMVKKYR